MGKKSRARKLQKDAKPASPAARPFLLPLSVKPSTERLVLLALFGAGLLLRIIYLWEYRAKSIFYGQLMLDAQVYDEWALRIAAGHWWGPPVFYHAPLYPYLLAICFGVLGHHYLPIYLLQLVLGVALLVLVYRTGKRCTSAWIGLAAAGMLGLYAPLLFFETKIMGTSLAVFLSTGALALLVEAWEKGGVTRWFLSGALIGLAALANPAALLLAPCFAGGVLARTRRFPEVGALASGVVLALAPATLHNLAAGGGPVLISAQGGITFYQGNMPKSRGLYLPVEGFSGSPLTQMAEEKARAEKEAGRPLRSSEVSSFWFKKGLETIERGPGDYLNLMQLKLLRWFSSLEYSTEYSQAIERAEVLSLWLPCLPFGLLAVGGGAGLFLGYRSYPRLVPLALYLFGTLLPPMIFYVSSRYRLPSAPALAILAATALERIVARSRARGLMDVLPVALILLLGTGLTLIPYGRDHLFQQANVHYNMGNLLSERGDIDAAVAQYREALSVSDFEFYRINLGNALTRKGRFDEGIEQYRLAAQKKPRFAKSYIQWAKALALQGKLDEARQIYQRAVQLGVRSPEVESKLAGTTTP